MDENDSVEEWVFEYWVLEEGYFGAKGVRLGSNGGDAWFALFCDGLPTRAGGLKGLLGLVSKEDGGGGSSSMGEMWRVGRIRGFRVEEAETNPVVDDGAWLR